MRTITGALIILTALIWIAWDIFARIHSGYPATESATLLRWSMQAPGVSFLVGMLMGHLFFPQTSKEIK